MFDGMVRVKSYGGALRLRLNPRGPPPTRNTCRNVPDALTVTVTLWPGETTVPSAGDVICSEGCACRRTAPASSANAARDTRLIDRRFQGSYFICKEVLMAQNTSWT